MEQRAQVIRLLSDGRAELRISRSSACGSCHSCDTRDTCSMQELSVLAENSIGALTGDTVTVQTSTRKVLLAAVIVYLLPLVFFLGGYLTGQLLGVSPIWTGGGAFVLAGAFAIAYNRYVEKKRSLHYTVIRIEKE